MRETRTIEFKETITNTFLKTVSAFSNYDGGEIFFGIDDNGNIKELSNIKQACLDIENKINDSITPQPDCVLSETRTPCSIRLQKFPKSHFHLYFLPSFCNISAFK